MAQGHLAAVNQIDLRSQIAPDASLLHSVSRSFGCLVTLLEAGRHWVWWDSNILGFSQTLADFT